MRTPGALSMGMKRGARASSERVFSLPVSPPTRPARERRLAAESAAQTWRNPHARHAAREVPEGEPPRPPAGYSLVTAEAGSDRVGGTSTIDSSMGCVAFVTSKWTGLGARDARECPTLLVIQSHRGLPAVWAAVWRRCGCSAARVTFA